MLEPFFFGDGETRLFGVWRSTPAAPTRAWLVCPPFAEEEKSAHRTLVEICAAWQARGAASLFFAYRGTGDSEGDFSQATLLGWRDDIHAAALEIKKRAPSAKIGVLGLRGGASLAAQTAEEIGADKVVLIEPILNGKQYLSRMSQQRRVRAMMTKEEGGATNIDENADVQDFDGWGFNREMRDELNALDLLSSPPTLPSGVLLVQVGPREAVAAPLQKFADEVNGETKSIVMQPFWNLLDYARADELIELVSSF